MSIHAKCFHCGKEYKVLDKFAGQRLPCKNCGEHFRVPEPPSPIPLQRPTSRSRDSQPPRETYETAVPSRTESRRARSAERSVSFKPFLIGIGVCAALAAAWAVLLPAVQQARHAAELARQKQAASNGQQAGSGARSARTGSRDLYAIAAQAASQVVWPPPLVVPDTREDTVLAQASTKHPQLAPADWSGSRSVALADTVPVWSPMIDAVPKSPRLLAEVPTEIDSSQELRRLLFSQPAFGRAVALTASSDPKATARLAVCDLCRCEVLRTIELSDQAALLDCAPDGTRAAVRLLFGTASDVPLSSQTRLDVWSLETGSHVVGWQPYENEQGEAAVPVVAAFLDRERLLTLNVAGKLVCWKIPECRAVYSIETGATAPLVMTPGRKYVGAFADRSFLFFDTDTGDLHGVLPAPIGRTGLVQSVAFRLDGEQMAAHIKFPDDQLVQWNLKTGQTNWSFPVPVQTWVGRKKYSDYQETPYPGLHWCPSGHLMLGQYLIDPDRLGVVFLYNFSRFTRLLQSSPDERLWCISHRGLAAITLPDQEVLSKLPEAKVLGPPEAGPGSKISLRLKLPNSGDRKPNFTTEVVRSLAKHLAANGMTCAPGQPITLVLSASIGSTGESFEYESFFSSDNRHRETHRVAQQRLEAKLAFVSDSGHTYWSQTFVDESFGSFGGRFVSEKEGVSVSQSIEKGDREMLWSSLQDELERNAVLPSNLFHQPPGEVLAKTDVTAGGSAGALGGSPEVLSQVPSRKYTTVLTAQQFATDGVAWSPVRNSQIASCGRPTIGDPPLKIWDVQEQSLVRKFPMQDSLTALVFAPDGIAIAAGTNQGRVMVFALRGSSRAKPRVYVPNTRRTVTALAWSPDGMTLLAGYEDGIIGAWPATQQGPGTLIKKFGARINRLRYTPDGKNVIATVGDGTVRLVNIESKEHRDLALEASCADLAPDGKLLAVGSNGYQRYGVRLFDLETAQHVDSMALTLRVHAIAFTPDGRKLAIGGDKGLLSLWNLETKSPICRLEGHVSPICQIAFSPDGLRLAARARLSNVVYFWNPTEYSRRD